MSSGTGWIPSRRSIPASVILGSLPAQELVAGSFLPLPMAGVCGTPRPPPADHKVAVPDQCPPSPSARMQWVGEEPAGCAGFLLSHKGGGDAHQQPGPPLEVEGGVGCAGNPLHDARGTHMGALQDLWPHLWGQRECPWPLSSSPSAPGSSWMRGSMHFPSSPRFPLEKGLCLWGWALRIPAGGAAAEGLGEPGCSAQ